MVTEGNDDFSIGTLWKSMTQNLESLKDESMTRLLGRSSSIQLRLRRKMRAEKAGLRLPPGRPRWSGEP